MAVDRLSVVRTVHFRRARAHATARTNRAKRNKKETERSCYRYRRRTPRVHWRGSRASGACTTRASELSLLRDDRRRRDRARTVLGLAVASLAEAAVGVSVRVGEKRAPRAKRRGERVSVVGHDFFYGRRASSFIAFSSVSSLANPHDNRRDDRVT